MADGTEQIKRLLQEVGLPDWLIDENGKFLLGRIVKYYREQKTYMDSDGTERQWTQKILAKSLKLKEHTVTLMETQNKFFDSIKRRQALVEILGIPSALLGLTNLTAVETLKTLQTEIEVPNVLTSKRTGVSNQDINLYQSAVVVYNRMYTDRSIQTALPEIEGWIAQIDENLKNASSKQKIVLMRSLWDFHSLIAKTYGYDNCDWIRAFKHIDEATKIAEELNDTDLKIACLYRLGDFRIVQGQEILAKLQFNSALTLAKKGGSPQMKGLAYGYAALSYALTAKDRADRLYAENLLTEGKTYAKEPNAIPYFETSRYSLDSAETYIALKRFDKALDILNEVENTEVDTRRLEFSKLLTAECLIKQKRPEYDQGVMLLSSVLEKNKQAKEQTHITHVERLHKILATSPYKNVPDVTYLGQTLRQLQRK